MTRTATLLIAGFALAGLFLLAPDTGAKPGMKIN